MGIRDRDRVDLDANIDHVKEDNRVRMEVIQKEQENLWKLQKQCGERCDHIDAAMTNITGQVRQNQEEIELIRTRPTNTASISTSENREGINFKNYRRNPMEFLARFKEPFNKHRITR